MQGNSRFKCIQQKRTLVYRGGDEIILWEWTGQLLDWGESNRRRWLELVSWRLVIVSELSQNGSSSKMSKLRTGCHWRVTNQGQPKWLPVNTKEPLTVKVLSLKNHQSFQNLVSWRFSHLAFNFGTTRSPHSHQMVVSKSFTIKLWMERWLTDNPKRPYKQLPWPDHLHPCLPST